MYDMLTHPPLPEPTFFFYLIVFHCSEHVYMYIYIHIIIIICMSHWYKHGTKTPKPKLKNSPATAQPTLQQTIFGSH